MNHTTKKRIFGIILILLVLWAFNNILLKFSDSSVTTTQDKIVLPTLRAEIVKYHTESITRRGDARLWMIRLEQPVDLIPYHFQQQNLKTPQTIGVWQEHLNAPLVINAGLYDETHKHLGLLKGQGVWISKQHKSQWYGLLVSGPLEHGPWARIVDLEKTDIKIIESYQNAVQSMMLFDENKPLRVRDTDIAASRMVLAQDKQNRILVLIHEGAVTLADLARYLQASDLNLLNAMNLDGGVEAQMALKTNELQMLIYGQYGTAKNVLAKAAGKIKTPLPSVIAIWPAGRHGVIE